MLKIPATPRKIHRFPSYGVGDLWRGVTSRKSHVRELENWMPMHSKKHGVGVELRAGGDPHRSEKPGCSAGDMKQ